LLEATNTTLRFCIGGCVDGAAAATEVDVEMDVKGAEVAEGNDVEDEATDVEDEATDVEEMLVVVVVETASSSSEAESEKSKAFSLFSRERCMEIALAWR